MAETARTYPAHRAREYETIYILRPNAGEESADKVATRIVEVCDRLDGKLVEVDVWGRRRLPYKIKGYTKGIFVYLRYLGYPGLVQELERNLRMLDGVLKYQSVKLNHEIDPSTVEVEPEAIQFKGIDFSEEVEVEEEPSEHEVEEEEVAGEDDFLDYEPEPIPEPPASQGEDTSAADEDAEPGKEDE